jgi:hypothetical protein
MEDADEGASEGLTGDAGAEAAGLSEGVQAILRQFVRDRVQMSSYVHGHSSSVSVLS